MAGAPKGSRNAAKGRLFGDAIRRAVVQGDGEQLRRIADKLLAMAEEGDIQAIREMADRLDGKAKQQTEISDPDGKPVSFRMVLSGRDG
jgi:ribosomal protein L17